MGSPSLRQLEKHIRLCAESSSNIVITIHARQRMRQRRITDPMLLEALRLGCLSQVPEPDIKHPGLKCRMQRFVAGMDVGVVVYVEHPEPELVVITVIDVKKD
jgi:hypothetical protein